MRCKIVEYHGHKYFVCGLARKQPKEHKCRCGQIATMLCDFPVRGARNKTRCDRPICRSCAHSIGEDLDLCPPHWSVWEGRG